jgi:chromosomal replication initiator protein
MEAVWRNIKMRLRDKLHDHTFKVWIEPIQCTGCYDNTLRLECPNKFFVNWVRENYLELFKEELKKENYENLDILLKIAEKNREAEAPSPTQLTLPYLHKPAQAIRRLNPEFTFDRFVTGNANTFAYATALNLSRGNGGPTNFYYFLSKTGLGKSHLAQAINAEAFSKNPGLRVHYLTAEDFVNEMVFSIKQNQMEAFKNRYRHECDILILEEVHFLNGKERSQAELAYTLDALLNSNRRVVVTSHKLPREIPRIESGLRSRLNSGLIINIDPPDYVNRLEILRKKASNFKTEIPEEILELIAHYITDDVRQMESCLVCLIAKSSMANRPLDLNLVEEVLKGFVDRKKKLDLTSIQQFIARSFSITVNDLKSSSRKQEFGFPRSVAMYFCRKYANMTLEAIGEGFHRNHATVLYTLNSLEKKIKRDNKLRSQVQFLTEKMEAFFLTCDSSANLFPEN